MILEFQRHGEVEQFGIFEDKVGVKILMPTWLGMDIFWNLPISSSVSGQISAEDIASQGMYSN